ncbi:transposase [Acidobacteria bacterium AH-259-G07]|nr:transposase [Acidobacteria bacterium AH-259-G07]
MVARYPSYRGRAAGRSAPSKTSEHCRAFLREVVLREWPQGRIHLILDNLSAHKAPPVPQFVARHSSRIQLHWTPTNSSWLNRKVSKEAGAKAKRSASGFGSPPRTRPEGHEKRARLYAQSGGWDLKEVYQLEATSGKSVTKLSLFQGQDSTLTLAHRPILEVPVPLSRWAGHERSGLYVAVLDLDQELRDKRIAFGMATKLMFRRYREQQRDPLKWKRFWKDVNILFKAYLEEQERAVTRVS